jgi:hypothetical protein
MHAVTRQTLIRTRCMLLRWQFYLIPLHVGVVRFCFELGNNAIQRRIRRKLEPYPRRDNTLRSRRRDVALNFDAGAHA